MLRLVLLMSRHRVLWIAWMSLGTPLFLVTFLLNALISIVSHLYGQWHWQWKNDVTDWFQNFGERHRKSLHSLGLKPEKSR